MDVLTVNTLKIVAFVFLLSHYSVIQHIVPHVKHLYFFYKVYKESNLAFIKMFTSYNKNKTLLSGFSVLSMDLKG
uniref:Uncharacterized protein n=1 Tax=Anguilla anguilla TaxID=7936 RepID=A0A0E9RNH4_ANGAN